ncbi:MAG: ADOP family duplicated permease [Candidatus Eisenbacteria bacterium]
MNTLSWDTLVQDFRQAARALFRARGLTVTATLIMALGIGATAAVVSLLDELALRPLALPKPQQLYAPGTQNGERLNASYSYPEFRDLQAVSPAGAALEAYSAFGAVLAGRGEARSVWGEQVSGGYFGLLGTRAVAGRLLAPADDRPASARVVVLSYDEWRRRFGAAPSAIGQHVLLNRRDYTVVGVAAPEFHGLLRGFRPRFWIPLATGEAMSRNDGHATNRRSRWLSLVARLESAAPASVAARWDQEERAMAADGREPHVREGRTLLQGLASGEDGLLGSAARLARVLALLVGVLLLLMTANLAGLLLARQSARRREMGVRLALGASRSRLLRQLLIESLMLAACGGAAGLLLAGPLVHALVHFLPAAPLEVIIEPRIDVRVLLASLVAVLVTGVAFGLAPALESTRLDVLSALRDDAGSGWWPGRRLSLRGALVTLQVALSFVLLVGAGLFARSLAHEVAVDPGYPLAGRHALTLDLSGMDQRAGVADGYVRDLIDRVRALPGIEQVSLCGYLQPSPGGNRMELEGSEIGVPELTGSVRFDINAIGPDYFGTLGVPLVTGREFSESEALGSTAAPVVVLNRALARRLFGDDEPMGRSLRLDGASGPASTVVGIVPDLPMRSLRDRGTPCAYVPAPLAVTSTPVLVVRAGAGASPLPAIERLARERSADVATSSPLALEQYFGDALASARMTVWMLVAFAILALTFAALGLYGLLAHAVARRTREIGVRMALGAEPAAIVRLVAAGSLRLVGAGLVVGAIAAFVLARGTAAMLYGVPALDPVAWLVAAVVLAAVSLAATSWPARRAARVRPAEALRHD